jgi:hypothetical protein
MAIMPERSRDIFETGQEPDFTVDEIARVEYLRDGSVRIYLAAEWRGGLRMEYSARVLNLEKIAAFGRALLVIAAGAHECEEMARVISGLH